MTDFLIKTFIKDYQNPSDTAVREKYGVFSSIVGIITNLILATIKLVAGILSFSIAITADALNNLSDAGSSIISFVSFKIAAEAFDFELLETLFDDGINSTLGAASGTASLAEAPRSGRGAPHFQIKKKCFSFIFSLKSVVSGLRVSDTVKPAAGGKKTVDGSCKFTVARDPGKPDGGILTGGLGNRQFAKLSSRSFSTENRKKQRSSKKGKNVFSHIFDPGINVKKSIQHNV